MTVYKNQEQLEYLNKFYTADQIRKYCGGDDALLDELWRETQPIEVDIDTLKGVNECDLYLADSPDGFVPVEQWRNKGVKECFLLTTIGGRAITASHDHLFQTVDGDWVYTRDLKPSDMLITDTGPDAVSAIAPAGDQVVYDLAIGHDEHRYYTNGICSHNSGKSIFLQNIALNWSLMGMNVIYITLELAEDLVNQRLDTMVTQYKTSELLRNADDVVRRVKETQHGKRGGNTKAGVLMVKKFPEAGTTANDIKAYLKEFQIKTGIRPDAVCIDYLDLMHPNNAKIDVSNLFTKDKYVSEEMRSIAGEWEIPVVSASQLNRQSVEAQEFDHSHIAGGISKINTADNVFGIFTSHAMRQNGKYQIQFLKTRSSSAVGDKLELHYDFDFLRLSDMPEDDYVSPPVPPVAGAVMGKPAPAPASVAETPPWEDAPSPVDNQRTNILSFIDDLKLAPSKE